VFQLQTGSYRALEQTFLDDLLAQKKDDPLASILVLSPSGHLLNHLQRQLVTSTEYRAPSHPGKNQDSLLSARYSVLNVHFLTFYALADRVLADAEFKDSVVKESALYREIINDFLTGRGNIPFTSKDSLVRSGLVPKGLAGALAATLKDLQDSGAKVVDCANVAREGHLGDALEDAIPALELNVLLYSVLHKHKLRTNADFIRRAAERVSKSGWIKQQKAIFLYGFYDLTGVQLELVQALANHPNAHIYFPYEEDNPAYGYAEKLLKDPALLSKCQLKTENGGQKTETSFAAFRPRSSVIANAWSCSGTRDEIWLAAKKILELADAGVPYHKISFQARTLDPYLNTIREIFDAHHIPYALSAEEPVGAWPIVKATRQALRASSPAGAGRGTTDPRPEAVRDDSWISHVQWALSHLGSSRLLSRDATDTERKLWNGILQTIEPLKELDALAKPVSRERFLEVVDEKLDNLRLTFIPENSAGVQVMDVMTARGLSFDALFLAGLNEKLFPRLIREDPFLSDAARSGLAGALGSRLGRKLDGYQEEKFLFALATQSAKNHLHLSCQRSDEEGKALVISLYLHDFIQKNGLELKRLPRTWPEKIQKVAPDTLTPKEISIALHRENRDTDPWYGELGWDRDLMNRLLKSQSEIEAFGSLGAHDGLIGKDHPLTKELLAKGLSPNSLKDMAECPFKIYSRKILSLDPEEHDVKNGEITRSTQGKLVHEILEAFYREFPAKWEEGLKTITRTVFRTFEKNHQDLYPLAWQAAQVKILAMLKRFIPMDIAEIKASGFKPEEFEISMSAEIGKPPVLVQGRIDRLDAKSGDLRVVDYKTGSGGIGKKEKVETAILKGKNFQLPVYMALAKASSAVFYRLEEGDKIEIDSDFWDEHGGHFYENLNFLVKNIEIGTFYIRPSDSHGYCNWCHFSAVCRKTHKPTQIRSESSPLRRAHEECFKP
jgi:ATP-dependent helicase/DNAse subunit B